MIFPRKKITITISLKERKNISQDRFCVQYFRGKKIHTDWDLRVEQAEFKELTVINFILLYMKLALKCFLCETKNIYEMIRVTLMTTKVIMMILTMMMVMKILTLMMMEMGILTMMMVVKILTMMMVVKILTMMMIVKILTMIMVVKILTMIIMVKPR